MTTDFGEKLRTLRKSRKMTLRDLSDRIKEQTGGKSGIDFPYISRLENGMANRPTKETILILSKGLGLNQVEEDEFLALAGQIPTGTGNDFGKKKSLPALLRTAAPLSEEQIKKLIEQARKMKGKE
jgi:transcriptional regulator with XRE-family HTH domain